MRRNNHEPVKGHVKNEKNCIERSTEEKKTAARKSADFPLVSDYRSMMKIPKRLEMKLERMKPKEAN